MTRWVLAALGLVLVLGLVVAAAARFLGRPGSRASIVVSVVASWLGAWILWSFAGGLLVRGGVLVRGASRGWRSSWAASSPGSLSSSSRTAPSGTSGAGASLRGAPGTLEAVGHGEARAL